MAHPTSVYEHITYVANPVDKNHESLEISVPVKVDGVAVDSANAPILFALSVGGYRSVNNAGRGRPGGRGGRGTGGPPKGAIGGPAGGRGMGGPPGGRSNVSRNTDLALAAGYVVVSPGCRGRDNRLVAARAQLTCRRVVGNSLLNGPPSQELQLPGIPSNGAFSNELPTFSITGFQQLGPPANTDSQFRTDVTELVDQISWQKSHNLFRAGLDYRWERLDVIQPPSPTGLFSFSNLFTDLPGTTGTGFSLASFLLGQVQTLSIDLQEKLIRARAHIQEYFIQDDWKVTNRLTINAGVRWTLNFPSTEVDNQGSVFNLQRQQLDYLGQNGFPRSGRNLHWHDFGPRLGLAYRVADKTVIRSAYALVWIEQAGITAPFTNPQFPFVQTVGQRTLDSINPAFVLASGPSVGPIPLTPDAGLGQGVFTVDRSLGSGYVQQWNLFLQREIAPNLALSIGYTGSKITHVGVPDTNINQLTVQQLAAGNPLLQRVPNPYYGQIPRSSSLGDPTIAAGQLLRPFPRFTTVSFFRNMSATPITALCRRAWKNGFRATCHSSPATPSPN